MNRIAPNRDADRPRVIAFGGGKGGAGRSTLTAEVARTLARQDDRVLCVDAAWDCPTLHTLLKADEPAFTSSDRLPPLGDDDAHIADFIENSGSDNIWLASLASARRSPYTPPSFGPERLIAQLHALDFDWVLLDLPAGLHPLSVSLFVLSDIPIVVATPEPAAVRTTTQFLRSALFQSIGYHPEAPDCRERLIDHLHAQPLRMTVSTVLEAAEPDIAEIVRQTRDRLETYVVVNLVREGAEQDLGHVLCHAWREELGVFPRSLSHVEYEDRHWFYHRRTSGKNSVRGDEQLSRDIEQVAKTLMDISIVDGRFPRPVPRDDESVHPALYLGVSPDIGRDEVRQHCRRLWEGFGRESAVELVFDAPDKRARLTDELESLYRKILQLPADSFKSVPLGHSGDDEQSSDADAPDGETSEDGDDATAAQADGSGPPPEQRDATGDDAIGESVGAETSNAAPRSADTDDTGASADSQPPDATGEESADDSEAIPDLSASRSPGAVVEEMRRRAGVSLHDLSMQTQIGVKYLTAIEDVELEVLPRQVYLRNYLREVAKAFDVDPQKLVDKYFSLLDEE